MSKSFKLGISRLIKSSFQSCRSKQASTLPRPHDPQPISSFKRHLISLGSSCGSKSNHHRTKPQEFQWHIQEEEWHIIPKLPSSYDSDYSSPRHKIYNSSVTDTDFNDYDILAPISPPPVKNNNNKIKRRRSSSSKKKKTTKNKRLLLRTSTSSDSGLFSTSEEETETLISYSRSFSTDSSTPSCYRPKMKPKSSTSIKRRVMGVEGKVKGSVAVVKKSEDPYEDFKRSMLEMICEKEIYEERELEQLLRCFLSLNYAQHHPTILQVFTEIANALFSP